LNAAFNLWRTARAGAFEPESEAQAPARSSHATSKDTGHRWLEARGVLLAGGALVAVVIGGLIEIVPTFLIKENVPTISSVKPYTPLELLGRDLYIREGCVGCHSQMIRPLRSETERYGEYSKAGEFVYDHPFLWGSKRTGPDLHRVGGKYPDAWHYNHMENPRSTSPGSIMPKYPWLLSQKLETNSLPARIKALRRVGVPYPDNYEETAGRDLVKQAKGITQNLEAGMVKAQADTEIIALIAYLQRLGTDIKLSKPATAAVESTTGAVALNTQP
jgi:cytochrome c oxidase cbb3-type subunit I/II